MQGKCDFYYICEQAFLQGLCRYVNEWAVYVEPTSTTAGVQLSAVCSALEGSTIKDLVKKKWDLMEAGQTKCPPFGGRVESSSDADSQGAFDTSRQKAYEIPQSDREAEDLLKQAGFGTV